MSVALRLPESVQTLPEALAHWAERTPDALALRSLDGRVVSHGELRQRVTGIVSRLRALGVGPRDQTAFVLPPGFDACLAMLGG